MDGISPATSETKSNSPRSITALTIWRAGLHPVASIAGGGAVNSGPDQFAEGGMMGRVHHRIMLSAQAPALCRQGSVIIMVGSDE